MKIFSGALALLFVSVGATAQQQVPMQEQWYWGIGVSRVSSEPNDSSQKFDYTNMNLAIGYQQTSYFGVEAVINLNVSAARDDFLSSVMNEDVDTKFDAFGLYLTGRTPGKLYATVKAGVARSDFSYSAVSYSDEQKSNYGVAYDFGAGYEINDNARIELAYSKFPTVEDPVFSQTEYTSQGFGLTYYNRF